MTFISPPQISPRRPGIVVVPGTRTTFRNTKNCHFSCGTVLNACRIRFLTPKKKKLITVENVRVQGQIINVQKFLAPRKILLGSAEGDWMAEHVTHMRRFNTEMVGTKYT
jgi:hypothetical protein